MASLHTARISTTIDISIDTSQPLAKPYADGLRVMRWALPCDCITEADTVAHRFTYAFSAHMEGQEACDQDDSGGSS